MKKPDKKEGLYLLRQMLRIRRLEEKSAEMYSALKIRGFLHLYVGEEAIAAGIISQLKPEDALLSTYREHGHALVRGVSAGAIMAEMYGKAEGCSMGRGGSMHLFDRATNFMGGNAIVGGHFPLAVGLALAKKMKREAGIIVCFFGEGAVAEGEFHESMNLASLWELPVLFVCENNSYAMGTALKISESMTNIALKAESYRIRAAREDGMDVLAVREAARKAIEYVRKGRGPSFLECNTYRFRAHSMFDAELYREKAEVEEWKKRDPLLTFREWLSDEGLLDDGEWQKMESEVTAEMADAVEFAEAGTLEPVENLTRFVYSEGGGK